MNFFRKHMAIKDKKIIIYLAMIAAVGALMMLWGRSARTSSPAPPPEDAPGMVFHNPEPSPATQDPLTRPERALEEELEEFLSLVAGAGRVRVMISAMGDRETVFAVDASSSRSHIIEEDAQGGTRDQRQYTNQEQTVIITDRSGVDHPLILREISPRAEGIVIIAEGGDDPLVRDALTRAAMAVLGIEAHRIQVLAMA